jgi:hypothetical protein
MVTNGSALLFSTCAVALCWISQTNGLCPGAPRLMTSLEYSLMSVLLLILPQTYRSAVMPEDGRSGDDALHSVISVRPVHCLIRWLSRYRRVHHFQHQRHPARESV